MKLRLHNRFIYVGVDISIYALLTGDEVYTSLVRISYCTIIIKTMCVNQLYLQG